MSSPMKHSNCECRIVTDSFEIKELLQFRRKILVDYEHWDPAFEPDGWDNIAVHFGAFINKKIIGCVRLIPGDQKPILSEFLETGYLGSGDKNSVEIGRLAIDPAFRNNNATDNLFKLVAAYALKENIQHAFLICWRFHARKYTPWGWIDISKEINLKSFLAGKAIIMMNKHDNFVRSENITTIR